MSTTIIATTAAASTMGATGTAALLGPLGLGLALGVAAIAFFSGRNSQQSYNAQSVAGANFADANLIAQQEEQRRQQMISEAWIHTNNELHKQAENIKSIHERKRMAEYVNSLKTSYIAAMNSGNASEANNIVDELRRKILSVQMEEQALESRQSSIIKILDELEAKAPKGFADELNGIRENIISSCSSLEEKAEKVSAVSGKLQRLIGEVLQANNLSLDSLEEETAFIPPAPTPEKPDEHMTEVTELKASMVNDICDFGARIAFFDEKEAERLMPLVIEAKSESSTSRLRSIRDQIKTTYGTLKERAVLTEMFRQDLREFLPPMKKAAGADELCLRMEELMTAPYITREEFNRIYKEVNELFNSQAESIIDKLFAEKVSEKLRHMGYALLDENGNSMNIPEGKICTLSTPYDGYRVRMKIRDDKTIATRLVRVGEAGETKSSTSEYQRQKDIETGKKLCRDLREFYKSLEDDGIKMNDVMRKEPEEEALDIIIETSEARKSKRAYSRNQEQQKLQQRRM